MCCAAAQQGAPRRTSSAQPAQQPYPAYGFQPQPYGYAYVGGYAGRGRARVAGRLGGPPGPPPAAPPGAAAAQAAAAAAYHGAMMQQQQQQPRPARPDARGGYGPIPMAGYAPGYGPAGYVAMPMGMLERPPPPGTPGVSSGLQVSDRGQPSATAL